MVSACEHLNLTVTLLFYLAKPQALIVFFLLYFSISVNIAILNGKMEFKSKFKN